MDKRHNAQQSGQESRSDMELLLGRFLDGMTTVEEEQRLARYFRETRDLPDEWQVYRDMFAYFDDGMPVGAQPEFDGTAAAGNVCTASGAKHRRSRMLRWVGWTSVAAAAAVGLLLVMQPRTAVTLPATQEVRPMYAQHDPVEQADDTLQAPQSEDGSRERQVDTDSGRKPKAGRRIIRHSYDMAPPKRYYAAITMVHNDTAAAAATEKLVAEQRSIAEEQQQLQEVIKETQRLVEETRANLVASENYADEY